MLENIYTCILYNTALSHLSVDLSKNEKKTQPTEQKISGFLNSTDDSHTEKIASWKVTD